MNPQASRLCAEVEPVRWQRLFADLAAQWEAAEAAADQAELASRTRAEIGAVRLHARLRAAVGTAVTLRCRGADRIDGILDEVGVDWLLLTDGRGAEVLVAWRAVQSLPQLGPEAAPDDGGVVRGRLDLRWALRALARDRAAVQVVLDDGAVLAGTVDRVGADFFDLAEHPLDESRRAGAVRRVHAIVIDAVALVRSVPVGWS